MGTRNSRLRRRATKRGLASFVSFLLLFAFALGQSSLSALADDAGTDPVAAEEVLSDGSTDGAALPEVEAPAEEAPAEEAPAAVADGEADAGVNAGAASTKSAEARTGQVNVARVAQTTAIAAPAAPPAPDTPGPPSGSGVQPILLTGNQNCAEVLGDDLLFEYRDQSPHSHTVDLSQESGGDVEGTLEITVHGSTFDFEITGGDPVWAVVVKGGSNANLFDYRPAGEDADTLLHAPVNPQNGQFYGLSHISFCWGEEIAVPGIDVEKECPAEVPFGEDVTFTITVTNTGNEPLENVQVTDALLGGDITGDFDFPEPFPVGGAVSAEFSYTPDASEDPVENSVTASGDGVDSGETASDTDECETDVTHEPGIDVTKSCPESVPFGEDIEYTITVENTGNEALAGVTVNDTLLGDITGEFDFDFSNPFPVGEVATAVVTYTPQAGDPDPITNTVIASGVGEDSGVEASAEASCETDIVNPNPGIDVEKECTELAHVGDTVTYTITVTNTGDEDLDGVTVMDTVLGDLSASFADSLAVGASESHEFDYVVLGSDPDPLVNEVTAAGTGVQSQTSVDDLANCATDIIHPAIEIVKTVDEDTVPIGTTVTFTYVVTNTGDTTLYDISVDDDILGHIGDIEILEPGQSVTLTKDFVVGDELVTNVGTATGEDILGRSVSADDDATVTPIAGENPPENPPTPFTGSDAARLGIISMVLFGIGVTVVAMTRRRRPEAEAA
jgi:uncharacterized repeat protein (TIGR01451 family)